MIGVVVRQTNPCSIHFPPCVGVSPNVIYTYATRIPLWKRERDWLIRRNFGGVANFLASLNLRGKDSLLLDENTLNFLKFLSTTSIRSNLHEKLKKGGVVARVEGKRFCIQEGGEREGEIGERSADLHG